MNRAERRRSKKLAVKANAKTRPLQKKPPLPSRPEQTRAINQAIDQALKYHEAGELPKVESICQQILQAEPNQPAALLILGAIAHQVGKNSIAFDFISKAIAVKPDYAEAHNNLGLLLHEFGKLNEAVISFGKAIANKPDFAQAHSNLGNAFKQLVNIKEAVTSYRKALAIKPDYAEVHFN